MAREDGALQRVVSQVHRTVQSSIFLFTLWSIVVQFCMYYHTSAKYTPDNLSAVASEVTIPSLVYVKSIRTLCNSYVYKSIIFVHVQIVLVASTWGLLVQKS